MSVRIRLIKIINFRFGEALGIEIPEDQPIKSHQKAFLDSGGMSWYFTSKVYSNKFKTKVFTEKEIRNDSYVCSLGSGYTMTNLLKSQQDLAIVIDIHVSLGAYEIVIASQEGLEPWSIT